MKRFGSLILLIALLLMESIYAQKIEYYKATNGVEYLIGDKIELKNPSNTGGNFKSAVFKGLTRNSEEYYDGSEGMTLTINEIDYNEDDDSLGELFICSTSGKSTVIVDIELAIKYCEIEPCSTYVPAISNIYVTNFKYDKYGISPTEVVIEVDSLSRQQLYDRTINWIKETYVNPDIVIKSTIEDEMIRITGVKKNCLTERALGMEFKRDARYTLVFDFKEGKYRVTISEFEVWYSGGTYSIGGWSSLMRPGRTLLTSKGKLRKPYRSYKDEVPTLFNDLAMMHHLYITKSKLLKKDDW